MLVLLKKHIPEAIKIFENNTTDMTDKICCSTLCLHVILVGTEYTETLVALNTFPRINNISSHENLLKLKLWKSKQVVIIEIWK